MRRSLYLRVKFGAIGLGFVLPFQDKRIFVFLGVIHLELGLDY